MRLLIALLVCIVATDAVAESGDVVLGIVESFHSGALDEERVVNIYLPVGHDPSQQYPVIYLLDGAVNEDYHHVSGLVQFLTAYQLMPPSILVGVANVDRYRDFTHPTDVPEALEQIPNAGNSERFVRYLGDELQPFIDGRYNTDGTRTIIGQSLGALLATEIFMKWPDYFDHYMIVSPSLWWDDGALIEGIEAALQDRPDRAGMLYLSLGTEGSEMQAGMDRFVAALEDHAPDGLQWWYAPFPEETHATILHRSLYRGFELFYQDDYPGL